MRNLASRLTYANVVATLALFVALGGASYAVTTLPAGSVGTRQLAPAAVTPPKLGFPLSTMAFAPEIEIGMPKDICNSPQPRPVGCDLARLVGGERVGHVSARQPGRIAVTAVLTFASTMPPGTTAHVQVGLFAGRTKLETSTVDVPGRATYAPNGDTRLTLQGVAAIPAGVTPIEVGAQGLWYDSAAAGEARIESESIVATVLPPA
jgi:hypothetical protein